jgi:hypothetical protein
LDRGGVVGNFIASPLDSLFHAYFSALVFLALIVVSILIIFNATIKFDVLGFLKKLVLPKAKEPLASTEAAAIDRAVEKIEKAATKPEEKPKVYQAHESKKNEGEFEPEIKRRRGSKTWTPPPLSLLEGDRGKPGVGDIKANANLIKRTLLNFGIVVEMDEISIGPSVIP